MRLKLLLLGATCGCALAAPQCGVVWADSPAAPVVTAESADAAVSAARVAANNAWMLTSAALVLFMTAPGLALFYGGLVRKKNVLSVMMQCVFLVGMNTVVWGLWGYSLAFGGEGANSQTQFSRCVGGSEYVLMRGVQSTWNESTLRIDTPMISAHGVEILPRLTHMLFHGMFFIITPALICGAFAERMKFSTMVVFTLAWGTLVYCPLAHMVWGGGALAFSADNANHAIAGGALDFAGGTVVHISAGVSALICALLVGRRLGYRSEAMPPHNLTYTAIGATMLWFGWFGFNAGNALESGGLAASAFAATHFAAAGGTIAWAGMEWLLRGRPSVLGACSGAVAGLVCITPAAGYVSPMPAIIIGFVAGVACYFSCTNIKTRFGYDDSLDAFGIHGVGGTLGAILTGVFATRAVNDLNHHRPLGGVDGNWSLLQGQLAATAVTWVYAAVATFIILKVLDATMGLRVSTQAEIHGLDVSLHGEEGYIFL